ncbi:MAG: chemotaxis protein CheW [Anaerotignaceae bacterium]
MKLLTFKLQEDLFAIDALAVKELNRHVFCTPVPTANKEIIGLYNMRGQIVTIIDLQTALGYEKNSINEDLDCIILKPTKENPDLFGFAVDSINSVIDIDTEFIKTPPANLAKELLNNLLGVVEIENRLHLILNSKKICLNL